MECLFQFVCSSNNHISRIHGMVERLCSTYGTPLAQQQAVAPDPLAAVAKAADPVSWHHILVQTALPMEHLASDLALSHDVHEVA